MADVILPVVGAVAGFVIGGPAGAIMGANLGFAAASTFFPKSQHIQLPTQTGPRLSDLRVQVSSYGNVISKIYGTQRLSGNVIWATDIKETKVEKTTTQSAGGKGGGGSTTTSQTTVSYEYSITLALAICEGEVDEVIRVWADSKPLGEDILAAGEGKYNVHLGTEDQNPDDIIGKHEGAGTYPAYRGLCYIVIEDFPLADYGNRVPNFTAEVKRTVKFTPSVEDKIKEMVLIPGAGEFVYGTEISTKQDGIFTSQGFGATGDLEQINMHNFDSEADVIVSVDKLLKTFPNLEWVAVVVTWFATATDAGDCTIIPKVEFQGGGTQVLPNDWAVGSLTRSTAQKVLTLPSGDPTYGGTPSDKTVVQICQELQNRGLNVMLYPMPFVDVTTPDPKPWRGRITPADATDANEWFTKTDGYNAFITHYANLSVGGTALKDVIDAFVIGSELVGMTGFSDAPGSFPAVNQLVTLAGTVKTAVGGGVMVTYAADWSEYHSTGGWFNLDPLWASASIDFVGIDAYFPLTPDFPQGQIDEDAIQQYWEDGEGWEYYWNGDRTVKTNFADDTPGEPFKYAWKNIEYWWSHTHENPDMNNTAWTAKMKPIWFTEYGFPSVDGCANQPNVFYDPSSSESFFPRASKGRINFQAQREALNATLDFWTEKTGEGGNANLIPKRFLWTWDARPFPFWPDLADVWADSILWPTGHWVNGKLGASSLGAIIGELLQTAGLTGADYDVTRLTDAVEGYIILQAMTVREAIEQLAAAYFFDAVESDGILKFVPRGGSTVKSIPEGDLVPNEKNGVQEALGITYAQELELPQRVNLTYINRSFNYDPSTQISQRQTTKAVEQVSFNLPLVMSDQLAKQITDITLYEAWKERVSFKLSLPPEYIRLEPTDIIDVTVNGVVHSMRIIKTDVERNGLMKINAVAEDVSSYDFFTPPGSSNSNIDKPTVIPGTILELVDAPPLPSDPPGQGQLRIAVAATSANWSGAVVYRSDDGGESGGNTFTILAALDGPASLGLALNSLPAGPLDSFDYENELDILLTSGSLASVSELALFNGANAALLGNELIQFQNATLVDEKQYRLTKLLRGRLGTEQFINGHLDGDRFILLTPSLYKQTMPNNLIGLEFYYKGVSVGGTLGSTAEKAFTYTGKTLKPFSPVHIAGERDGSNDLTVTWVRRTRTDGEWRDGVDVPLNEDTELYEIDIMDGGNAVRTLTAITPSVVYSEANQITDFGSAQSSVTVNIYQMSATVGRGYAGVATV